MLHRLLACLLIVLPSLAYGSGQCPAGHHWVKAHFRKAYLRASGVAVKAATVSAHCQANPEGYTYWRPRLLAGQPPLWPNRQERAVKWAETELEQVAEALGELPKELWEKTVNGIYRMDRSELWKENPATSSVGAIVLYEKAFKSGISEFPLAQVLAHELAHEKYRHFSPEMRRKYEEENGWNSLRALGGADKWVNSRKDYIRSDGADSPEEDFANNVEYFVFNPAKLKVTSPSAYQWLKHHFGDRLTLAKGK